MELRRCLGNDGRHRPRGNRRLSWRAFDRRADGIAAQLLRAGLGRHDKVALYLHNTPEYLESAFAAMKSGLVPVNTNYRYQHDELHYLWDNDDAAAVIFDGEFIDTVDALRARCPHVRLWLHVATGTSACPPWAVAYEVAVTSCRCASDCAAGARALWDCPRPR